MASWILVPSLVSLRAEFNTLAPGRDKTSDGSIGDAAHASSPSDHNPDETGSTPYEDADSINEVHAIDVDRDLRKTGWTMERALAIIISRHRSGKDDRLQNIIFNRRIWSRTWGWTARTYTGSNPHDKHAHFSARYESAQSGDKRPWGLLEEAGMGVLQPDDKAYLNSLLAPITNALRMGLESNPDIREAVQGLVILGVKSAAEANVFLDSGMRLLWLAAYSRRHDLDRAAGGSGYPAYLKLSDADKTRARNALDLMQELGLTTYPDPQPAT